MKLSLKRWHLDDATDIAKDVTEELKMLSPEGFQECSSTIMVSGKVCSCTRGLFWRKCGLNYCTLCMSQKWGDSVNILKLPCTLRKLRQATSPSPGFMSEMTLSCSYIHYVQILTQRPIILMGLLYGFSHSLQADAGIVPHIKPWLFSSKSSLIHSLFTNHVA